MMPTKTINELFIHCPGILQAPKVFSEITAASVEFDSRTVKQGSIFVAFEGEYHDGHTYIQPALEMGAAIIVGTQQKWCELFPDKYVWVEDARKALAYLAAAYYDFPARKMIVIGVTGTDGKTTTTNLIFQILKQAGFKAGMISTVNAIVGEEIIDTGFHVTTPEAPMVQEMLARMVELGLTHVVLETTSHGLAQHRVAACEYDIGVVTNITHEHLDYHGTYENYVLTKARLLTNLAETQPKLTGNIRLAVLNQDDRSYTLLQKVLEGIESKVVQCIAYSRIKDADIHVLKEEQTAEGLKIELAYRDKKIKIASSLIGGYNVSNIMAAVGATAIGLGIEPDVISAGIAALPGIPGRMEKIVMGQAFTAIVDFAHTPNAMKVTLETARAISKRRVIAIFGSAGLRDREKRKMMAIEGVKQADICIFTAEDPRTEKLDDILMEMQLAAEKAGGMLGENFFVVADRGNAIRMGINLAEEDDLVIACGKGHEQSMCFEKTEYLWDDRTAMRSALAEFLKIDGPEMPYLPTAK
ncbi:MAG: UDP-N-acetylmuramoyl-L-alanyl-D-glutamate--2,6-diaminopimelate ligase [Anaerolineaceae bacterium]